MTDLESANPHYEHNVKLCAAIKKHKCLHDHNSYNKHITPECEKAWQLVANECNETIEFCKNRWRTMRRSFFQGLERRGNKYYLHEHLKFLLEEDKNESKLGPDTALYDETNSADDFHESEMEAIHVFDDDDDIKSVSSKATTSADESNDVKKKTSQVGVFIIKEIDEHGKKANKEFVGEKRSNPKRLSKRSLDQELIDELAEEERDNKRARKTGIENRNKDDFSLPWTNKQLKIRMNKLKANVVKSQNEMIDRFTHIDRKPTRDFGTQYEVNSVDCDDIFMQSISIQLQHMNGRQKMNFKRKVYQSLMEVFDDATDFPNIKDVSPLPHKQQPRILNTSMGELRLMRELVSLVQAAKTTPEIMHAKEKVKISPPPQTKPPVKVSGTENQSTGQTSPLSLSPAFDDDDFQFPIDNINDEDDASLPRSWDEIKAKRIENPKPTSENTAVGGLPRRVLQKVVRVAGSNGSTIVTREGDKKRIYRIYPKAANPNDNRGHPSFLVSSSKNSQDPKNNNVGTFFVSPTQNSKDATVDSIKISNSVPNITIRPFNSKPTYSINEVINSVNKPNQSTNLKTNGSAMNSQTCFKNVHPTNRILSATTGYFKMVPSSKTVSSTYIQQPTSAPSTGSSPAKMLPNKSSVSPMLPPAPNTTTKRTHTIRSEPQVIQRRFSICGPPADKIKTASQNSSNTKTTSSKSEITTENRNPQQNSAISRIQVSQPVSLNNATAPDTSTEAVKIPLKPVEKIKEPADAIEPVTSSKGPAVSTSTKSQGVPMLETAGTVAADVLDPLFVKPQEIKSEPVDE